MIIFESKQMAGVGDVEVWWDIAAEKGQHDGICLGVGPSKIAAIEAAMDEIDMHQLRLTHELRKAHFEARKAHGSYKFQ